MLRCGIKATCSKMSSSGCTWVTDREQGLKKRDGQEVLSTNKECGNEVKKCVQAGRNGPSSFSNVERKDVENTDASSDCGNMA